MTTNMIIMTTLNFQRIYISASFTKRDELNRPLIKGSDYWLITQKQLNIIIYPQNLNDFDYFSSD